MVLNNKYFLKKIILTSLFLFFSSTLFYAQRSNTISSISFGEIKENKPVDVKAVLINPSLVSRVQIVYKSFHDTDFKISEMEMRGNVAQYQISGEDISAPILSYYLIVEMTNGTVETYPLGVPDTRQPINLTVATESPKDKEILILSPSDREAISLDELFISVSLINVPDIVDISQTKIILNGEDITSNVLFAGELLLYYPQNFEDPISSGEHNLIIKIYNQDGELYNSIERSFVVIDKIRAMEIKEEFRFAGNVYSEVRNEFFNDKNQSYQNLSLNLNAGISDWKFKGYGYITSEEKGTLQPQNRYSISASNNWLSLRGGDSYPRYNNLLLDGKRVRGVDGKIDYGIFHIQGTYGEIRRGIEGALLHRYSNDNAPLQSNVIRIDSAKYGAPFGMVNFGTHSRNLLSGRIGVGSNRGFELGISFLHSKDEVNSVEFGVKPEENFVASTDLRWAIDDQKIILKSVSAISILNSDITFGTFSNEQIDSIFASGSELGKDAESFKNIKNMISPFMTVNQFIEPTNFAELSSFANESSLELNYFNNRFKASYIYRGNQFKSFGQEFTRTDVAGVNITDRFRTLNNQLFFTIGYENLSDNLQGTKIATTSFQTLRASVSLFMRGNVPNITLGYIQNKNKNDIDNKDTLYRSNVINDITNRLSLNLGYDFNFIDVRHNSSLSLMTSTRDDNSYYDSDAHYFSSAFTLNSYWSRSLISNFSIIHFNSEIATVKYKYITISAGGRYRLLNDDLELSLNYSPSFGDFNRHAIDFIASYQVVHDLWLRAQMRYYSMKESKSNTISGITVRYNF